MKNTRWVSTEALLGSKLGSKLVSRSNISCKSWFNVGMAQKNESKDGVKDERNIKKEEDEKGISVSIFDTTVYINRLNER